MYWQCTALVWGGVEQGQHWQDLWIGIRFLISLHRDLSSLSLSALQQAFRGLSSCHAACNPRGGSVLPQSHLMAARAACMKLFLRAAKLIAGSRSGESPAEWACHPGCHAGQDAVRPSFSPLCVTAIVSKQRDILTLEASPRAWTIMQMPPPVHLSAFRVESRETIIWQIAL